MESVSEPGFFSLLRRQCFHGLQIEVVIQVEIVQIFAMDEEIQHIIPLTAHLKRKQIIKELNIH